MSGLDGVCLVAYFILTASIGWFAGRRSRGDARAYFLGGGSIGWLAIGASLFASNISSEHFIGLASTGGRSGLAVGQFEWLACLILLLLGWLFVPFYLRTGVFTMPEFLETRYNRGCRTYLSIVSLIAYIFTKVSVSLYAGALVLKAVIGVDEWTGATIIILVTGAYTIFGGLRAVIYTDYMQAGVLIGGATILTVIAVSKVGGLSALSQGVDPEFFNLWKPSDHPDFPWTGILFGAPILGIWYWCTDQMIVQRTLAARGVDDARRATLMAGYLKILPVFILVLPGVAGAILFPDVARDAPNQMYATMVRELLPAGVRGIVMASLLAAVMSSLSSVFNSTSTIVTMDFYRRHYPDATQQQLVRVGQIATLVIVVIGMLWIPFIQYFSDQLYIYLQSVQAYVSPPIAAVFLVGILWRRASGAAALAALLTGFVLGAVRFVTELGVKSGRITGELAAAIAGINFLHFAILLFAVSLVVLIVVSVITTSPSPSNLRIFDRGEAGAAPAGGRSPLVVWGSVLLVVLVLAMWAYFSPWVW